MNDQSFLILREEAALCMNIGWLQIGETLVVSWHCAQNLANALTRNYMFSSLPHYYVGDYNEIIPSHANPPPNLFSAIAAKNPNARPSSHISLLPNRVSHSGPTLYYILAVSIP